MHTYQPRFICIRNVRLICPSQRPKSACSPTASQRAIDNIQRVELSMRISNRSSSKGVLQGQKKDGQVIARSDDGWLVIEKLHLSEVEFEEIFATSIAIVEKARRNKKHGEEAEAVGEVISALAGG
ncbi:hypothetical protein AC579_518 [Pseudocercospora musae]|uniref:Uncharacterized protein n=1 Tax=Pseudocercospora musae TaxID=113226 RepID=A0A139IRW3_9PEZI|nr:hypothetical protein AC579_518 [Pseudocercospora musae]